MLDHDYAREDYLVLGCQTMKTLEEIIPIVLLQDRKKSGKKEELGEEVIVNVIWLT